MGDTALVCTGKYHCLNRFQKTYYNIKHGMQKTANVYSELAYKKILTPVNLYAEGLHTYPLFAYKNPILNNFCAQNVCKSMQKYSWFAYILHTCLHTTHQSSKPLGSFAADAAHSTVRHSREAETSDVLN